MSPLQQVTSAKDAALLEEAARRACATGSRTSAGREAVLAAVRAAFAGGTTHMFGLVRAGSAVRP